MKIKGCNNSGYCNLFYEWKLPVIYSINKRFPRFSINPCNHFAALIAPYIY